MLDPPTRGPPPIFTFSGYESILYKRALSYYYSYVQTYWQDRFDKTSISYIQWCRELDSYSNQEWDWQTGRWWARSWQDLCIPAQGGLTDTIENIAVGHKQDIFTLGEFSFNNEGKINVGHISFYFDARRNPANTITPGINPKPVIGPDAADYGINIIHDLPEINLLAFLGLETRQETVGFVQRGNLYSSEYVGISLKTFLRLHLPNFNTGSAGWLLVVTQVGLELDIDIAIRHKAFAKIYLRVRELPNDKITEFTWGAECFVF